MNKVININLMRNLLTKQAALARIVAKILQMRDCFSWLATSRSHLQIAAKAGRSY
jgi:hypothetical protein